MPGLLTPKQEKFCQLYIKYNVASWAYRESYNSGKMKPATINRRAKELLDNGKIAARIKEIQAEMADKLDISPERTLREFARIGFSDVRKLLDSDGRILPTDKWPDDIAAAVSSLKTRVVMEGDEPVLISEIKMWPKTNALEALSKHLGLFEKDNRQKSEREVNVTLDPVLAEMIKSVKKSIEMDAE